MLASIAEFNSVPIPQQLGERIWKITWRHNGEHYTAKVGRPAPQYFGGEEVISILENGSCYYICKPNRGVVRGGPILTNKTAATAIVLFSA